MALSILELLTGDTSYITKHNTNYANIKAAIESLQAAIGTIGAGEVTSAIYRALFGESETVVGSTSYLPEDSATANQLTVAAGYAYLPTSDSLVTKAAATTLNFLGQTTGTYYVHVDATGEPYFNQTASGALYSVYYDSGTGDFTSISRVSDLVEDETDQENTRSNYWDIVYSTIDERLDGVEKATFQVLALTVTSGDLEITTQEAFEQGFVLLNDGPQTADIDLTIPSANRIYLVNNDCSQNYYVEFIPSGQPTGYSLRGQYFAVLYCDGTTVTPVFLLDRTVSGGGIVTDLIDLNDTPASYTSGDAYKLLRVNATYDAIEFYQAPSWIVATDITFENLNTNGDVGTGSDQVAAGNHSHTGYGDVSGPASSTDNTIVLFDGTTGKLIKDSGTTLGSLGGGDVTGPASSTTGNLPSFSDTTGKALQDSGFAAANLIQATDITYANLNSNGDVGTGSDQVAAGDHTHSGYGDVSGPVSAVDERIAVFDGTTGKLLKDGGSTIADLGGGDVSGPASATDSNLAAFDGTSGKTLKDAGYALNDSGTGTSDLWSADKIQSEIDSSKLMLFNFFSEAAPTASQLMLFVPITVACTIPSGMTMSRGYANTTAAAQTDFDVKKNGASVGTIRWAASTNAASFIAASPISCSAGDRLEVYAPATPDTTLAALAATIYATRD